MFLIHKGSYFNLCLVLNLRRSPLYFSVRLRLWLSGLCCLQDWEKWWFRHSALRSALAALPQGCSMPTEFYSVSFAFWSDHFERKVWQWTAINYFSVLTTTGDISFACGDAKTSGFFPQKIWLFFLVSNQSEGN